MTPLLAIWKNNKGMERLLTIEQISELLQIKKSTIYSLVNQKRIPFIKLSGKLLRFKSSEIEKWLDGFHSSADSKDHIPTKKRATKGTNKFPRNRIEALIESVKSEVLQKT